jgi:molybdate transport system ATP-binding protein
MNTLQLQLDYDLDGSFNLTIDCHIPATGITAIFGPSGCGKTTLLHCIAGLKKAQKDSLIRFAQSDWQSSSQFVPPWLRRIGFVFQDARLFPHLTVLQNLNYAVDRRASDSRISLQDVVQWLQLTPLLERPPERLSGGQIQRVAIARALLCAPQLLLMDEPLANLDHSARQECLHYLTALRNNVDLPILYVSHDMEELSQIADHLVLMEQGRIVQQGPLLALCSRLDTSYSEQEQAAAILEGTVTRHDEEFELTEIDVAGEIIYVSHLPVEFGAQQRLRIPARDVSVCKEKPTDSSILNIVAVKIAEITLSTSGRTLLRLSLGDQYLLARITQKSAQQLQLKVGDKVFAQIKSVALLTQTVITENA